MAKDYAPTLATSKRLIDKFGRTVTLASIVSAPLEEDKPWLGATEVPTLTSQLPIKAAFIGLSKRLGEEFLKDLEEVAVVATADDLSGYHVVLEGTTRWNIVRMETVRPGDTRLITYLGLKR